MELTKNELDLALRSTQVFSTEYYHGVLYDYHATVTLYHERVLNEVHRPEYTARLEQVLATACTAEVASEPARTGKLLANRLATLLHPVDTGQISTHRVYAMSTGIQELDAWSLQSESRDGIHLDTLLAAVIRMYFDRARHYLGWEAPQIVGELYRSVCLCPEAQDRLQYAINSHSTLELHSCKSFLREMIPLCGQLDARQKNLSLSILPHIVSSQALARSLIRHIQHAREANSVALSIDAIRGHLLEWGGVFANLAFAIKGDSAEKLFDDEIFVFRSVFGADSGFMEWLGSQLGDYAKSSDQLLSSVDKNETLVGFFLCKLARVASILGTPHARVYRRILESHQ